MKFHRIQRLFVLIALSVLIASVAVAAQTPAVDKIDLNKATIEQLTSLPGIGNSIAARIVEYRAKTPFTSIEQIMEVKGIGQKTFDKIKDLITV
jgi:competence protein ComEA